MSAVSVSLVWRFFHSLLDSCPQAPASISCTTLNIVRKKQTTVTKVLNSTSLNMSSRWSLVKNKLEEWHSLVRRVAFIY